LRPLIGASLDAKDYALIAPRMGGVEHAACELHRITPAVTSCGIAPMPELVEVTCTARLHMGFLDLEGSLGRRFGSIGLALDAPRTRLSIRRAETNRVRGPEQERAGRHLAALAARLRVTDRHDLHIEEAIPEHSGLGSGTQLALGVAAALRRLHGLPLDPAADAEALGRGQRSGIGIGLFRLGGLVVDGGIGRTGATPPMLARLAVPADWRILLVIDPAYRGLSGSNERAAFAGLEPMPAPVAARLCRHVLMQVLPAVAEDDLAAFGAGVSEIQALIGDYFAPVQGGCFTSRRVGAALAELAALGATGIGQSSWGPAGFAFARGDAAAGELRDHLVRTGAAERLDISICRALNRGAAVIET
jgi:beta-ribofuranosylaminobenzene 5'-phosphate synthase